MRFHGSCIVCGRSNKVSNILLSLIISFKNQKPAIYVKEQVQSQRMPEMEAP